MTKARIIGKEGPIVAVLAEMILREDGLTELMNWVQENRPDCVPEGGFKSSDNLYPHDMRRADGSFVSDMELLCELAGRKCYDSFSEKGSPRSNAEYLKNMWDGKIPHRSTGYHAKMTFFFANISRRVSHELIRNYVGSDRNEEGSPSQESTRYTYHPGVYVAPVRDLDDALSMQDFEAVCDKNYTSYRGYVRLHESMYEKQHGKSPTGLDRKRIYEAASNLLLQSAATSFIWTTNPMALSKMFAERCHESADLEIQRFAKKLRSVCISNWPNLFQFEEL